MTSPVRVAIVGGGCAGLATAFELSRPEHQGRFAVSVYQMGWRLGGKGASSRGPAGRIEEHGIHLWYGCYENAFRLIRECYAELDRHDRERRFRTWQEAFTPCDRLGVFERTGEGEWLPWLLDMDPAPGMTGDPPELVHPFTIQRYLVQAVRLFRALLASAVTGDVSASQGPSTPLSQLLTLLDTAQLAPLDLLLRVAKLLESTLQGGAGAQERPSFVVRALQQALHGHLAKRDSRRRVWEMADLVLAFLRGALHHGLVGHPAGLDAIDDYDLRIWLRRHGASSQSLQSAFLRALYDIAFAFEDGDPTRPRLSAASALRMVCRLFFTYRGPFYWRMNAGMGEVVFAPFYEVLRRRGVRFHFFHRLEDIQAEEDHISALTFDVQAKVRDGEEYRPLLDLDGLRYWPDRPLFDQLEDGARLRKQGESFENHWRRERAGSCTLRVGKDFDFVVLAVGLGAIPTVASSILRQNPAWQGMVQNLRTVATQAFQLWLEDDMARLGWKDDKPGNLVGSVEPFATWTDMSHLIPEERWRRPPGAIAYFCSPLRTPREVDRAQDGYPHRQHEQVRRNAVAFLEGHSRNFWPGSRDEAGDFRWDSLVDEAAHREERAAGPERFANQYWTANVQPSDRYVLALPGTSRYRISPLDRTYDNLTLAGDWTQCGFNIGSVEAAMISGRVAAHALSGSPALADILGFDQP